MDTPTQTAFFFKNITHTTARQKEPEALDFFKLIMVLCGANRDTGNTAHCCTDLGVYHKTRNVLHDRFFPA